MPNKIAPVPRPVTGGVGFGCGFVLSALGFFAMFLPESRVGVIEVLAGAMAIGFITSRLGEPFFRQAPSLLPLVSLSVEPLNSALHRTWTRSLPPRECYPSSRCGPQPVGLNAIGGSKLPIVVR